MTKTKTSKRTRKDVKTACPWTAEQEAALRKWARAKWEAWHAKKAEETRVSGEIDLTPEPDLDETIIHADRVEYRMWIGDDLHRWGSTPIPADLDVDNLAA